MYEYVEDKNHRREKVMSDLMTTDWAKNKQKAIRNENTNQDIFLSIILYTDGVALGFESKNKTQPLIARIGNYSDKCWLRKYYTKMCLGYIPYLDSFSIPSIKWHLDNIVELSNSAAE